MIVNFLLSLILCSYVNRKSSYVGGNKVIYININIIDNLYLLKKNIIIIIIIITIIIIIIIVII